MGGFSTRVLFPDDFNELTEITTSSSEGLNFVLKYLQDHKELSLDCVCLSFYNLSIYYYSNEITNGFGNTGEYCLRKGFQQYCIDSKFVELRKVAEPSQIDKDMLNDRSEFIK